MLLAQQDARPLIEFTTAPLFEEYGIPLAIMGILVVFSALVLVVAFITLLPRVLSFHTSKAPAQPTTPEDELSPELVAVIATAATEMLGQPHRVVKIRGMTPADLGWSLKGRLEHHQSHKLQQRDRR